MAQLGLYDFGLIDGIIKEPLGGAHTSPEEMVKILKKRLKKEVTELFDLDPDERVEQRIDKFGKMGEFELAEMAK